MITKVSGKFVLLRCLQRDENFYQPGLVTLYDRLVTGSVVATNCKKALAKNTYP